MGMSRCYSLMKCLLIIFNIIFLAVGCGAGGFAAWALYSGRGGESAAARAALCALAAWAVALAAGALAALAGALRHSASLLALAFALLALSGVAEGAAAWWGAAHVPTLRAALQDSLERAVRLDYGLVHSRTQLIDAIQHGLHCCGSESARDWQQAAWTRGAGADPTPHALDLSVSAPPAYYEVPASCCESWESVECQVSVRVPAGTASGPGLWSAGCAPAVLRALSTAARPPLAAATALLAAHAITLLLTLALCLRTHPEPQYKA